MKYIAAMALTAGLAIAGGANAGVNLVQNGGFSDLTDSAYYNHEFGADTTTNFAKQWHFNFGQDVADWISPSMQAYNIWFASDATATTTNAVGQYSPPVPNTEGGQYLAALPGNSKASNGAFIGLDASSRANGPLEQLISGLQVGAKYELTFYWATAQLENRVGQTTDWLQYSLGGSSHNTAQVTDASHGATDWVKVNQTFTATSSKEWLSFLAQSNQAGLPPMVLLDGVSLTAVPEPATWAMMLVGFGAIGYGLRRRRAAVVAA